jgi:hypothetical protein
MHAKLDLILQRISNLENNLYFLRNFLFCNLKDREPSTVSEDQTQQYEKNIFTQKPNPRQEVTTPAFNQNKEISFPEKNKSDVKEIVLPANLHSNGQKDFASPKSFGTFQQGGLKNFYESVPEGMNFTLGRNEVKNEELQVDEFIKEDESSSESLPDHQNEVQKIEQEPQEQEELQEEEEDVNGKAKEFISDVIDQVESAVNSVKQEIESLPVKESEEIVEENIRESKKTDQIKEVKETINLPPKKSKPPVNQWDDGENTKTLSFLKPKTTNKKSKNQNQKNQKKYKKGYQYKKSYYS